jgi:hypothetical protein
VVVENLNFKNLFTKIDCDGFKLFIENYAQSCLGKANLEAKSGGFFANFIKDKFTGVLNN